MTTFYDVLDIPPNSDVAKIKGAFRKAVKLSHPDLNVDDPAAAARLSSIVRAKTILSDPELRALYDRMLDFECQQSGSKLLNIRDVTHTVVVAAVLAGVFTLFTYGSEAPLGKLAGAKDAAHEPVNIGARRSPTRTEANGGVNSKDIEMSVPGAVAATTRSAIVDRAPMLSVAAVANLAHRSASDIQSAAAIEPSALDPSESAQSSMPSAVASTTKNATNEDTAPIPTVPTRSTTKIDAIHSDGATSSPLVKDARFYREQGVAAYRNGDVSVAIADFNLAIRLDPGFKTALIDRGIAFYRLGEFKRAFADVAEARRIAKSNRPTTPHVAKRSRLPDQ
jgi:curved DNA-binding protein CbpA